MKESLKIIGLLLIINIFCSEGKAQSRECPDCPPLPQMYVNHQRGESRKNELKNGSLFSKSKYKRLVEFCPEQDTTFFFTLDVLKNLLDKFYVDDPKYDSIILTFAQYDKATAPIDFPPNVKDKEVIFLFWVKKDKYYFLLDNKLSEVPSDAANGWINAYLNVVLPNLTKSVKDHPSNRYNEKLSDTRSIRYAKDTFIEAFVTESAYQLCKFGVTVSGFKVSLSSYTKDGTAADEKEAAGSYKKRFFLQYSYMKKNASGTDEVLSLEEEGDFPCRSDARIKKFNGQSYVDNGQLCPTYCPKP